MPQLTAKYTFPNFDYQSIFQNDFYDYSTALFTTTSATGTVTVAETPGGAIKMDTGAAVAGYEIYVSTAKKWFLPGNTVLGNSFRIETRVELTEPGVNQANFGLFLTPNAASGLLVAGNAGPINPFTGLALYKVGGSSVWQFLVSDGSTQRLSAQGQAIANEGLEVTGAYTTLALEITPVGAPGGTVASSWNCVPLVDGQPIQNAAIATPTWINFQLNNFTAVPMYGTVGLKNGGIYEELAYVDYLVAAQRRVTAV